MRALSVILSGALLLAGCGGGGGNDRNTAPRITGLGDLSISANETSTPLAFTVADDGGAGAVQLTASSDNDDLLPAAAIQLGGQGANRTLALTPNPAMLGTASVLVTATDADGLSSSVTVQVAVVRQPVSFSSFFRDTFGQPATAAPRDLNSRSFAQDAAEGEFDDLVGGP